MGRNSKKFNYTIVTDGVSVSIEYVHLTRKSTAKTFKEELEEQSTRYNQFGAQYIKDQFDLLIGSDPGVKLFVRAVVKDVRRDTETTIKISSKQFYQMTNQHIRDKKAKNWTGTFEDAAKADRENTNVYDDYPSPQKRNYMQYIRHRFKFFEQGIRVYTAKKYTRLNLDKYICTQNAMDSIVNIITKGRQNGRMLVYIGATQFNPSSLIRKYRRCPGIRKLVKFLCKIRKCDIVYVDEYNTSKVCGRCHSFFEKFKHKQWDRKKIRHRVCDNCKPVTDVLSLPQQIITPKSQRTIQSEQLQSTHNVFHKYPQFSWSDSREFARQYYTNLPIEQKQNIYNKTEFNPVVHQPVQKIVWNRDVTASRNILIKGIAVITNTPAPPSLQRPATTNTTNNTLSSSSTST